MLKTCLWFGVFVSLCLLLVTGGCAGSTQFVGSGMTSVTVARGGSASVVLTFEAEGSHAGDYLFTAAVQTGDGLTASVSPTSAEVDGTLDITVTVTATDTATNGSLYVEGREDGGDLSAGTSVDVDVQ